MIMLYGSEHGQIISFVVQLECQFTGESEWIAVIRYDTVHGYTHRDTMHPFKEAKKARMSVKDYNEAFTSAINDVINNRHDYRRRYKEWLSQK